MRPTNTRMHVVRAINRSVNYVQYWFYVYTRILSNVTTCFHVHELRAAVYGRADLRIPGKLFGTYRMRPTNTSMHVVWAIGRLVKYVHY